MSWDEKAKCEARETYFSAVPTAVQTRMVAPFVEGARWQRDNLRTDEAIERVAEAIYLSHDRSSFFTAKPWAEMVKSKDRANKFRVKQDRKAARAAITALLGEEPRP